MAQPPSCPAGARAPELSLARPGAGAPVSPCRRCIPLTRCALVVKSESVRNIIRERRMLEYVNHPFICNLRYSFQDIEYMCASPATPCPHAVTL